MLTSFLWSEYNIENAYPNLNFDNPVGIYHSGDNTNRIFILEQEGIIKVFNNDASATNVEIFLDITSIVDQDGGYTEEGLLGLAFHPNYNENGYFFVNYTSHNPRRNVIARYNVSANNPNQADEESSVIILEVNQPYTNHNGGQLSFGPDAYLYIIFGDGGSAGDPHNNGQNLTTLLGSLIRIDVDNPTGELNYGIPPDNPFIAPLAARDEIYAYGLRNMWRFSWDFETGLLWGADVGQNAYEEIDIIYSGLNYGWNTMEGNHCFPIGSDCNTEGLELPIWEYELYVNDVCSITGGYVYRGNDLNGLIGKYIYGDWCTGDIWALTYESDNNIINQHLLTTGINITTFGLDQFNELLFCGGNQIFKITSDFGDLNDDSTINVLDIIILVNHILNPATIELDGSDINDDGEVNILDIVHLVNIILN
jgi:glucose/arabinose dehydrogenase